MIAQLDMIENSLKKMVSFKASFDTYDVDGDGAISPPELRKAMADHGVKLSETEIAVIFNRIDVDGDGSISKVTSIRGLNLVFITLNHPGSVRSHTRSSLLFPLTQTMPPPPLPRSSLLQIARSLKLSQTNSRPMPRTEQRRPWKKAVRPC